jgi:hypothetical protein
MESKNYNLITSFYILNKNNYPVLDKIKSFRSFSKGWHYDEGEVFNIDTINVSLEIAIFLYNNLFFSLDVFPGFNGEIMVKAYVNNRSLQVFIEKKNYYFIIEDFEGHELFESDSLDLKSLKSEILIKRNILFNQWSISESYPSSTTTIEKKKGLRALPSKTRPKKKVEEYPLYVQNAPKKSQKEFACILKESIPNIPTLQYSGNLRMISCP